MDATMSSPSMTATASPHAHKHDHGGDASPSVLLGLTALCAVTGIAGWLTEGSPFSNPLYAIALVSGGWAPVRAVLVSFAEKRLDINFLMVIAAVGAVVIGEWGEGVTLMFLFSLSGALEKLTLERAARSIEALIELRPTQALKIVDGKETPVPVESLVIGDLVRVKPGERLAVDGLVREGASSIDQSSITGESIPVDKHIGDPVFAGTLNTTGSLVVEVKAPAGESTIAKIVRTVRSAQEEKPASETFFQKWQGTYAVGVIVCSIALGLLYYFRHENMNVGTHSVAAEAFYRAMVFLVAVSPCAVMMAAPSATLAGLLRAARSGILFKGGLFLEKLATIKVLALDKTGTLTLGEPKVVTIIPFKDTSENRILLLAASVEQRSEHPLARAVVREARSRALILLDVGSFHSHTGMGAHAEVTGEDNNGIPVQSKDKPRDGEHWIGVGTPALFDKHGMEIPPELKAHADALRAQGQTALLVLNNAGEGGLLGLADTLRPEAHDALETSRKLGVTKAVMLTGDHKAAAESVGKAAGVDEVHAALLPQQKLDQIAKLRDQYGPIAMIGDGVNDAPALARADVGIAMGGAGSDVALETADMVLMKSDLSGLPTALWLAKRTQAAISRGLTLAFGVIAVLAILSVTNILPLWVAVVFHEGSTVAVILSGLYVLIERRNA